MAETVFTYDWQNRGEDILKWIIPTLIAGIDKDAFDQLSTATDRWTRVELGIRINGVDMPVERFMNAIERNMTHLATKEAARLFTSLPRLEKLRDAVDEADRVLRAQLITILADAGVELPLDDE